MQGNALILAGVAVLRPGHGLRLDHTEASFIQFLTSDGQDGSQARAVQRVLPVAALAATVANYLIFARQHLCLQSTFWAFDDEFRASGGQNLSGSVSAVETLSIA